MSNSKVALLSYLADKAKLDATIPSISQLGHDLGLSTAAVREQLEIARQLELVEIKTKTGIQRKAFSLTPALCLVSRYGMEVQPDLIWELISVRQHLELAFWQEAVVRLSHKEIDYLADLIEKAEKKIQKQPVVIPLEEHSEFHLSIYRSLNNTFLNGILETYWQLSQETEFRMYSDQVYLENVWAYHKKIQRAIATKEYDLGYQALMTHFELVRTQKKAEITQRFE